MTSGHQFFRFSVVVLVLAFLLSLTMGELSPSELSARRTRRDNYCDGNVNPSDFVNWQHIQNGYDILTGNPYVSVQLDKDTFVLCLSNHDSVGWQQR